MNQTIDEKGIAAHFINCVYYKSDVQKRRLRFLTLQNFAILQDRATRDIRI
jgi:hypothetical protein